MSSPYRASPIKGLESKSYRKNDGLMAGSPVRPMIAPFVGENEHLNQLVAEKNAEIDRLLAESQSARRLHEEQIALYQQQVQSLESQIREYENTRNVDFEKVKLRFEQLSAQESSDLKSLHSHEVQFLIEEIAQQKVANESQTVKLNLKDQELSNLKESYERELTSNASEINTLQKLIKRLEAEKEREVRDEKSKRELEKSRTSGLISSRRESNNFMDKQVRKLNEEALEKTILLESANRDLNREKKKFEDAVRAHSRAMTELSEKYEQQIEAEHQRTKRIEGDLKAELREVKEEHVKLFDRVQTLRASLHSKDKESGELKEEISEKVDQIAALKRAIEKAREEHAVEITNLMKERRKSRSNIGSSRSIISLKESGIVSDSPPQNPIDSNQLSKFDSQFSSGRLDRNLHPIKEESPDRGEQKDYSRELADSNLQDEMVQTELQRAVLHYDNLIEELKRNHGSQVELLKMNYANLRSRLQQKEHELLDILTRFSPLVKIHAGEKSVEEDRRQRVERHWKGDVTLLQAMLTKYKINLF